MTGYIAQDWKHTATNKWGAEPGERKQSKNKETGKTQTTPPP